jgi:hypothetical protein
LPVLRNEKRASLLTSVKTFARIINHRLLATTPREIFFEASAGSLSGVSAFLAASLATHLYHHARKPCSSGYSELPEYVNHVVDELLD